MTARPSISHGGGFSLGYRESFDGIRGVGVLIIMGAHSFIQSLAAAGTIALQTFFLMSGFLITVLLVREWERHGRIDIRKFYVRRALRLLPALVLFIGVSCVLVAWTLPEYAKQEHYKAAIAALFYFYNWGFIYNWFYAGFLSHCWSLAVEEQFYLFWPALLIVLLRLPLSRLWKLAHRREWRHRVSDSAGDPSGNAEPGAVARPARDGHAR